MHKYRYAHLMGLSIAYAGLAMADEAGNGAGAPAPWVAGQPLHTTEQPAPGQIGLSPSSVPVVVADPAIYRVPRTDETENPVPTPSESTYEAPRLHAVEGRDQWTSPSLTTILEEQRLIDKNLANPVASVALAPATATIAVAGTQQLTKTVLPAAAPSDVIWTSANTAKATVSASGLVTGVASGSAVITATSKADPSKKATSTITVS